MRLLPLAASVAATSGAGTWLAVRIDNKVIVSAGLALFGLALLWTSRHAQATSCAILAAQDVLLDTGLGLTQAPAAEAVLGAVPVDKAGVASAVNGSTRATNWTS